MKEIKIDIFDKKNRNEKYWFSKWYHPLHIFIEEIRFLWPNLMTPPFPTMSLKPQTGFTEIFVSRISALVIVSTFLSSFAQKRKEDWMIKTGCKIYSLSSCQKTYMKSNSLSSYISISISSSSSFFPSEIYQIILTSAIYWRCEWNITSTKDRWKKSLLKFRKTLWDEGVKHHSSNEFIFEFLTQFAILRKSFHRSVKIMHSIKTVIFSSKNQWNLIT